MQARHCRAIVIGGGVSGLAAVRRLATLLRSGSVTLVESTDRLGGIIRTELKDGFTLELGPDSFLVRKPRGVELCSELSIPLEETRSDHRGAYLKHHGQLCRLPEGLSGLVPSRLGPVFQTPLLSLWGKVRFALDHVIPSRQEDEDESVTAFFSRRIGGEATARIVEPLLEGIYGGGETALSLRATFPDLEFLERSYGSLLRGLRRRRPTRATTPFVAPRGGMERLVEGLCQDLSGVKTMLCAEVTAIERADGVFVVRIRDREPMRADAVVVAAPAAAAACMLKTLDAGVAETIGSIPYGSVITLHLAYRAADVPHALGAYGYIVPRSESESIIACTFTSSKFPRRAPADSVLLRLFVGRSESVFQSDTDALVHLARKELHSTLGITTPPLFVRIHKMVRAIPRYVVGHLELIERIDLPHSLRLAGAAYRGVGIPDCIRSGEGAADTVAEYLSATFR